MKTCIVIPAYNEGGRIEIVVKNLLEQNFVDIIVVDDGSTDNTLANLQKLPIIYTAHSTNLGQGAALRTGTRLAILKGFEAVIHFDADGQHRLEDLSTIINELHCSDNQIILGSRFLQAKPNLPLKKKIILTLAKLFSSKILMLEFTDPQSGLRAFRTGIIDELNWQHDDFAHCTEILSLISKNKLKFREIPITVNYNKETSSKQVRPQISLGWKLFWAKILNRI